MNSKHIVLLVSLIVLASMLAIACSVPAPTPEKVAETVVVEKEAKAVETAEVQEEVTATAAPEAAEPVKLTVWWWGEQEAPGMEGWMDETVKMYTEEHPNVSIETVLQSTESLYTAFRAAAQAKQGPDIQYLWSGIYTMEDVWAGNVAPLSDYAPEEVKHIFPSLQGETAFDGKVWGLGWYVAPIVWAYNKELFNQAGLDANQPPVTWDELLMACDQLKAAGITPIGYGLKLASGHGNFAGQFLVQELDNTWELLKPAVGDESFTDPKYSSWLVKLDELNKKGCFNDDIMSLDLQQGADLFPAGKVAMTIAPASQISGWEKELGPDKMAGMLAPVFGQGKAAGTMGNTAQQLAITSFSPNKEAAAGFLAYMHTPERLAAMYQTTRALPPDDRLDPAVIESPFDQQVLQWGNKKGSIWYQDYLPSQIDREAVFSAVDKIVLGEATPEEAAQFIEDYAQRWRTENPDTVATLKKWLAGVQ
jgi:raffinose/stachyose/melibiose transport system substrate-binding protein